MLKLTLILGLSLGLFASTGAHATTDDPLFQAEAGTGFHGGDGHSVDGVVDLNATLILDGIFEGNVRSEIGILLGARNGGVTALEIDATPAQIRVMGDNSFGYQIKGLPFKYRHDSNYYELSAVDIRMVYEGELGTAMGGTHRITFTGGVNPVTRRGYGNNLGSSTTAYATEQAGDGYLDKPGYARAGGAPQYQYDPSVTGTYLDNRSVYFGGGTVDRQVRTDFDTAEHSIRFPLSAQYAYQSKNKKLKIEAMVSYTLRAGRDSLTQNDRWSELYRGFVSYSNVHWNTCYDPDSDANYACNPQAFQYNGNGEIAQGYVNATNLDARGFVAHQLGAQGDVTYSVYKDSALELLLNGRFKADYDSHVMAPGSNGDISNSHDSKHYTATGGAIVRF